MTIQTSRYPPPVLTKRWTQNGEPNYADIAQQLTGAAATIVGHIDGGPDLANTTNTAPRNPSNELGHDHSGGEFGKPLFRSIYSIHFDDFTEYSNRFEGLPSPITLLTGPGDADETTTQTLPWEFLVYVPPCPLVGGAYVDMGLVIGLEYDGNNGTQAMAAGDTVKLRLIADHRDLVQGAGGHRTIVDLTLGSPSVNGFKRLESGDRLKWILPGQVNPMRLKLVADRGPGVGARFPDVKLLNLEIGVFE